MISPSAESDVDMHKLVIDLPGLGHMCILLSIRFSLPSPSHFCDCLIAFIFSSLAAHALLGLQGLSGSFLGAFEGIYNMANLERMALVPLAPNSFWLRGT